MPIFAVKAHLGAGRVQLISLGPGNDHQVPVGLESSGHGPLHLPGIIWVYVIVHDRDQLDVTDAVKACQDGVSSLPRMFLLDAYHRMKFAATRKA